MPLRIVTILDRLKQDLAAELSPNAIEQACKQEKYSWRQRMLDPVTTVYLFILQILHGNTACSHVVHFGQWNFTDAAYCAARKRLPLAVLRRLAARIAESVRTATTAQSTWHGHRVWLADGSSFSMPDTPELQEAFGQPSGQRRGCGFPVAKFLGLFDLATGMLLRVEPAPLRSHEMARCAVATSGLLPGDIALGDRGFCSYAHLAILLNRKPARGVPAHQRQIIDFTPGRPQAPRGKAKRPHEATIRPHSRWVLSQGDSDQVVVWSKPKSHPRWIPKDEYASLQEEITVRELCYKIYTPGYRVGEVTLVTTLLDAAVYPAKELAELYFRRWQVEVYLRDLKITIEDGCAEVQDSGWRVEGAGGVRAGVQPGAIGGVRGGKARGVAADRVSVTDTIRWLVGAEGDEDLSVILTVPKRKGRCRAPREEAPPETVRSDDQAPQGTT